MLVICIQSYRTRFHTTHDGASSFGTLHSCVMSFSKLGVGVNADAMFEPNHDFNEIKAASIVLIFISLFHRKHGSKQVIAKDKHLIYGITNGSSCHAFVRHRDIPPTPLSPLLKNSTDLRKSHGSFRERLGVSGPQDPLASAAPALQE